MSTESGSPGAGAVGPRHAERPEPAERGATTVAELAVERIATKVVADSAGVGGTARRLLGIAVGQASADRDAEVAARLRGASAVSLSVRCSVPYPTPVAEAVATLRGELSERIDELTGLSLQRVDVTVTSLVTASGARVR
jgi:uncharacterized alkaline shock family protein YloU